MKEYVIDGVRYRKSKLSVWAQFYDSLRHTWVTSRFLNIELSTKSAMAEQESE